MTIASEITRLQWAKSDIKTSIENKGVSVPSDAKLDTYDTYIDQIVTWVSSLEWVKLYNYMISQNADQPEVTSVISWNEGDNLYWLCGVKMNWDSNNSTSYWIHTFKRIGTSSDFVYQYGSSGTYQGLRRHSLWSAFYVYKNGNSIRAFVFYDYNYNNSQKYTGCYQCDWNISTGAMSFSYLWTSTYKDYDISSYNADVTWFEEITGSTWCKSATGNYIYDDAYIYLTLK